MDSYFLKWKSRNTRKKKCILIIIDVMIKQHVINQIMKVIKYYKDWLTCINTGSFTET